MMSRACDGAIMLNREILRVRVCITYVSYLVAYLSEYIPRCSLACFTRQVPHMRMQTQHNTIYQMFVR